MKRVLDLLVIFLFSVSACWAENYPDMVTLESSENQSATFLSLGEAQKKDDVLENASKSLFHTLFYIGVEGINEGQPLVSKENVLYTNSFFNSSRRFANYVTSSEEAEKPKKQGDRFRGNCRISLNMGRLLHDMQTNKVYLPQGAKAKEEEPVNMPTIIVVPYKMAEESYEAILQHDFDRRLAVSKVQEGFSRRDIPTVDLEAKIAAVKRREAYEENSQAATSNDKELLKTSGADVYVTVELRKDIDEQLGSRVTIIMKAYETATGRILATNNTWTNRFRVQSLDVLCNYAVEDNLPKFMNDIVASMKRTASVVLQFAIDGSSALTFSDKVGPKNYPLREIIRQWVRKNAYKEEYHLQGIVDESMIFDMVKIPPRDKDGLVMDAAQFGFLIESHLKEEHEVDCSSRIDGNNILITIR
ncbi:MAG: hypothetical protein J6W47_03105 [Bacteroidales bacterium]|nr:hypothetical protein [Bacteroidales bacterium]